MVTNRVDVVQLTMLRGIAVLFVVFSYITRVLENNLATEEPQNVFSLFKLLDLGSFGVTIFFALSGATLYLSNKNVKYKEFLIKRIFRIWPAFAVSMCCYLVLIMYLNSYTNELSSGWVSSQLMVDVSLLDIVFYLAMLGNYIGQYQIINGAYWSLPIEFQYYLIFPLLIIILRIGTIWVIPIVCCLYFIYLNNPFSANDFLFYQLVSSFIGGVCISKYLSKSLNVKLNFYISSVSILLIILCALLVRYDYLLKGYYYEAWCVLSLALVMIVMKTDISVIKELFLFRWLERIGLISYSAYLYHNLVLFITSLITFKYFDFSSLLNRLYLLLS